MKEQDLQAEIMGAAAAMPFSAVQRLIRMGADKRLVAHLTGYGDMGTGNVTLTRNGWEPEGPDRRLLIAVRRLGVLLDIVAVASHVRNEWALRTGLGWALGIDAIEDAHAALMRDEKRVRLKLHATPFDWLAAGGDGLCVLDWCPASLAELRFLGERVTIEVAPGAAERLKALLTYGGLPRVSERGHGMGIAA